MNINDYLITEDISALDAMKIIDNGGQSIVFICDNLKLKGVLSDGDIRRYIIKGGDLNVRVGTIANCAPVFAQITDVLDSETVMREKGISALPIVDSAGNLVSIKFLNQFDEKQLEKLGVPVVIMAGGKGTRLLPYTQILPKPLIPIDDRSIIECIMDRFMQYACMHFDVIVNYKRNLIISYFQDCEHKYDISFVEENEFLGTAGGLRLIRGKYQDTFFVTNCDILIDADYADIYRKHKEKGNIITLVCAEKKVVVPYGIVKSTEDDKVISLQEKPEFKFVTNAGMYLVEPEFIDMIPEDGAVHITEVIQDCINCNRQVGIYRVSENAWMDMGTMEELEKMKVRMEE